MEAQTGQAGQALARVLAARGVRCDRERAARLADTLLHLVATGCLRPTGPHDSPPNCTARSAVLPSAGRGAVGLPQHPTVYNMGCSNPTKPGDAA